MTGCEDVHTEHNGNIVIGRMYLDVDFYYLQHDYGLVVEQLKYTYTHMF